MGRETGIDPEIDLSSAECVVEVAWRQLDIGWIGDDVAELLEELTGDLGVETTGGIIGSGHRHRNPVAHVGVPVARSDTRWWQRVVDGGTVTCCRVGCTCRWRARHLRFVLCAGTAEECSNQDHGHPPVRTAHHGVRRYCHGGGQVGSPS